MTKNGSVLPRLLNKVMVQFPTWYTVSYYFYKWANDGTLDQMNVVSVKPFASKLAEIRSQVLVSWTVKVSKRRVLVKNVAMME